MFGLGDPRHSCPEMRREGRRWCCGLKGTTRSSVRRCPFGAYAHRVCRVRSTAQGEVSRHGRRPHPRDHAPAAAPPRIPQRSELSAGAQCRSVCAVCWLLILCKVLPWPGASVVQAGWCLSCRIPSAYPNTRPLRYPAISSDAIFLATATSPYTHTNTHTHPRCPKA